MFYEALRFNVFPRTSSFKNSPCSDDSKSVAVMFCTTDNMVNKIHKHSVNTKYTVEHSIVLWDRSAHSSHHPIILTNPEAEAVMLQKG